MNAKEKEAFVGFKTLMNRIAIKNDDEFEVTMTSNEKGHYIEVIETADRHTLLDGNGATVEEAIASAVKSIPDALESWGYDNVA